MRRHLPVIVCACMLLMWVCSVAALLEGGGGDDRGNDPDDSPPPDSPVLEPEVLESLRRQVDANG